MTSQPPNGKPPSFWRDALVATTLGWNLAVPIFAGVLIGYELDRWLGQKYIFTIGLLMLGIFIGFYNLFRTTRQLGIGRKSGDDKGDKKGKP